MEITSIFSLVFSLLFLLPAQTFGAPAHHPGHANVTAVFAFGDSIFDTGNNNYITTPMKADHAPYGHDFPGHVATGRFSNGRLVSDFIVSKLHLKELLPAYLDPRLTDQELLTGACFASAGMGLDPLSTQLSLTLPITTQLDNFEKALVRIRQAGGSRAHRIIEDAVYIIAAGTNDMIYNFYTLPLRLGMGLDNYQNFLLNNLEGAIRRLYQNGARRIAVTGLPPIGCLPLQMTIGSFLPSDHLLQRRCVEQQNADSQAYNTKLQGLTTQLQKTLNGSRVRYVDIYNPLLAMIKGPAIYGFTSTHSGCCGTGNLEAGLTCNLATPICANSSNHVFWDSVHPTEATYSILADHFERTVLPGLVTSYPR